MTRFFGLLHVRVVEGLNVQHAYTAFRRRYTTSSWYRKLVCGADIRKCGAADACGAPPDPYAVVALQVQPDRTYRLGRTKTVNKALNPKWDDEFSTLVDVSDNDPVFPDDFPSPTNSASAEYSGPHLIITIFDDDMHGPYNDDLLAQVKVSLKSVISTKTIAATLTLRHPQAKPDSHTMTQVNVEFRWYPLVNTKDPSSNAVPNSYYKRSHGNVVHFYHDAHCLPGDFPALDIATGKYEARSCWQDIYDSVCAAEHFILFAGWSINTATRLTRSYDETEKHPETIGELLKRRSEDGVEIILMCWDDVTSVDGPEFMKSGIMATYDEYTREYFKGTKVKVILAKRTAGDDVGTLLYPLVGALKGTSFTHHQKIVLMDGPNPVEPDHRRVIWSYVGGLDLTSGRYDTSRHELFATLKTAHHEDFYNGCILDATANSGPREPWHDVHARIIGPAAWDVLATYRERLKKQAPDALTIINFKLDLMFEKDCLRNGDMCLINPEDPHAFDVQVFRSLDTESAVFDSKKFTGRYVSTKNMVDRGIQAAYLYLIDKARNFIYIENQYFLGSAQYWRELPEVPAWHLVPYAICRRICRAIRGGEQFCAYILIPLFPEGAPSSGTVQEILHWQFQTIRMMYNRIGSTLKAVGKSNVHPHQYLQFFFVGKREPEYPIEVPAKASAELANALNNRRLQIYVHSKMMIVDDEYLIMGSANINERSMAGCRDTEIAFGCWQPAFTVKEDEGHDVQLPRGDVHGYRLHLWHEHLGSIAQEFLRPADPDCSSLVKSLSWNNWLAFSGTANRELPHGHLCTYPLFVHTSGEVEPHPDYPHIPGTQAKVCGTPSSFLPSALTT